MKQRIEAILTVKDKKSIAVDKEGKQISIEKTLARKYNLKEGEQIILLILSDDGKTERPFSIEEAKLYASRKKTDIEIITADGRAIKLYTASAAGDYPVVGLTAENFPCCWDAEGNPQNGNADFKLLIRDI